MISFSLVEALSAMKQPQLAGVFAFVARRPELIVGRHVLLVDDILTTGATAGECARCLTRAGAGAVGVLTVARVD